MESNKNNNPLYKSIRKYGFDKFNVSVIDTKETWTDICIVEISIIKKLNAMAAGTQLVRTELTKEK